ncbi:MAG: hypothetical protein RL660_470 [Bacteroidota bacterium]|jgi:hypothetical protein
MNKYKLKLTKDEAIALRSLCKLLYSAHVADDSYSVKMLQALYLEISLSISKKINSGCINMALVLSKAQVFAFMHAYTHINLRELIGANPFVANVVRTAAETLNKQLNEPVQPNV